MSVPNAFELTVVTAAAYRAWRLLAHDIISQRPRTWVLDRLPDGDYWPEFLLCPWCLGAWTGITWWAAWQIWPHPTLVVAVPFAISLGIGLIATRLDTE